MEYAYPEVKRPYVFIDSHADRKKSLLNIRSMMIPRSLPGLDENQKFFAPVVFVPKEKINELPFLKKEDIVVTD